MLTAVSTTIISFLPVFTMIGAEGKLFRPLAFTKTFALIASVIVALTIIPPAAHVLFTGRVGSGRLRRAVLGRPDRGRGGRRRRAAPGGPGRSSSAWGPTTWSSRALPAPGATGRRLVRQRRGRRRGGRAADPALGAAGPEQGLAPQPPLRRGADRRPARGVPAVPDGDLPAAAALVPGPQAAVPVGAGGDRPARRLGLARVRPRLRVRPVGGRQGRRRSAGGPHCRSRGSRWRTPSPGSARSSCRRWTKARSSTCRRRCPTPRSARRSTCSSCRTWRINAIPEVDLVVGKIGRVDSPLDPAPISMIETIINYKSEYITDENGHRLNFRYDEAAGEFARDERGELIPDPDGRPFRQWRDEIRSTDDIWDEIVEAGTIPGIDLGAEAPADRDADRDAAERHAGADGPEGPAAPTWRRSSASALEIERLLKQVPSVEPSAVVADRIVGKPYLEIDIDRDGDRPLRPDDPQGAGRHRGGHRRQADHHHRRGPRALPGARPLPPRAARPDRDARPRSSSPPRTAPRSRWSSWPRSATSAGRRRSRARTRSSSPTCCSTRSPGYAEVDVVEDCQRFLAGRRSTAGELVLPAGVSYRSPAATRTRSAPRRR